MKHLMAAVLVSAFIAAPGFAADPAEKGGEMGERMAKELNLSADQKKQIQELRKKSKAQIKEKHKALRNARKELRAAMKTSEKGAAYQATLLEKFKSLQSLENEVQTARFQMALEMREVLNPDQIAKFKGLMGGKGPKGRGDRGRKHPGPDGDSDDSKEEEP